MSASSSDRTIFDQYRVEKYLDRISVSKSTCDTRDIYAIRILQQHALANIPFENLSLHYSPDHVITLNPDEVFEKIVVRRRGGYCFENNLIFAIILRSLGYRVHSGAARVNEGKVGLDFTSFSHHINIVYVDGEKYLVDVGFGSQNPTCPLLLEDGQEEDGIAAAKLRLVYENIPANEDPNQRLWIYQRRESPVEEWKAMYCFQELEFLPRDFEMMNFWTSQSINSIFLKSIMVAKFIMEQDRGLIGVVTLLNGQVSWRIGSGKDVLKVCEKEAERITALEEFFGITFSAAERRGITGVLTELRD